MKKSSKKSVRKNNNKYTLWGLALVIAAGVCTATGIQISVHLQTENVDAQATIELSPEQIPALIEYGQGEIAEDGILTVESVDSHGPQVNPETETPIECPEDEECGRGAAYPEVDTSTPEAFISATLGKCYDIDGYFNEQCWDYAALFFLNYAGHTFYTCGSGAAKGAIVDGCWQKNAGDDFIMIWDPTQLQPGDVVVFNNGEFGHVGLAAGYYNNGYVTLAGQNQGAGLCPGSTMGARTNIINISLKYFAGAFRPEAYIQPEPTPEPTPEPVVDVCSTRVVKWGDTMGHIMLECTGEVKWGADMDAYAQTWYSKATGESVFFGWTHGTGYGLLAGDTITKK